VKVWIQRIFIGLNVIRFQQTEMATKLREQSNLRGHVLALLAQKTTFWGLQTCDFVVAASAFIPKF
jgi:hypothetical protein